jgi:hypothetical protein
MRASAWILAVSFAVLLFTLVGCGGSSTTGKASSPSEKKTEDKPTPPKSDPG